MPHGSHLADDPLDLWRAVTDLSPRVLPEPGPAGRNLTVKDYLPGHHLPWEPVAGHLSSVRNHAWTHTVWAWPMPYGRLFPDEAVRAEGPEEEGGKGRPSTEGTAAVTPSSGDRPTALFVCEVSESGETVPGSLEVSRALWRAAGCPGAPEESLAQEESVSRGESALPGAASFPAFRDAWSAAVLDLWKARRVSLRGVRYPHLPGDVEQDHPLEHADVAAAAALTRDMLGGNQALGRLLGEDPASVPIRVRSVHAPRAERPAGAPRLPVLNHPSALAVDEAAGLTRFRQAAAGLLGVDAPEVREDILRSRTHLYYAVAPRQVPVGAPRAVPSTAATQFAVDAALTQLLEADGVWACPRTTAAGEPGPETVPALAAAVLTHRARKLAQIPDPLEIFDPEPLAWGPQRSVPVPHPDLEGHELLHAMPGPVGVLDDARAGAPRGSGRHPARGAAPASGSGPASRIPGSGPFGVRVVLSPGMEEHVPFLGMPTGTEIGAVDAVDVVLNALGRRRTAVDEDDYRKWDRVCGEVLDSQHRAEELLAQRQRYHEAVPLLMRAQDMTRDIEQNIHDARASVRALRQDLDALEDAHRTTQHRWNTLSDAITAHLHAEPGMWRRAVTLGRVRGPWRDRLEALRSEQGRAARAEEAEQARIARVRKALQHAESNHESLRDELEQTLTTVQGLREELAAYPWPDHAMDQDWLAGSSPWSEPGCPWLDPEVQEARAHAYEKALEMQAMAIRGLPEEFRAGLKAARDLLGGRPVPDADAALAAWQILCTVFPEVRVDPELLPRLLSGLGRRRLGWVLFDEADRLSPAVAYAGLIHARRGVLLPGRAPGDAGTAGTTGTERPAGSVGSAADEDALPSEEGDKAGPATGDERETGGKREPHQREHPAWARGPREAFPQTFLAPPPQVQADLARASSCSVDWAPARTRAYGLGLRYSRYAEDAGSMADRGPLGQPRRGRAPEVGGPGEGQPEGGEHAPVD